MKEKEPAEIKLQPIKIIEKLDEVLAEKDVAVIGIGSSLKDASADDTADVISSIHRSKQDSNTFPAVLELEQNHYFTALQASKHCSG